MKKFNLVSLIGLTLLVGLCSIIGYTNTLGMNTKKSNSYLNQGVSLCQKGDFDGAIKSYKKAIELNSEEKIGKITPIF